MANMDWARVRAQKLDERRASDGSSSVLVPPSNTFHGIDGGAKERIKILKEEAEQRQIAGVLDVARRREEELELHQRNMEIKHHNQRGSASRQLTPVRRRKNSKSYERLKKPLADSKLQRIRVLHSAMFRAIERNDVSAIARLASKIFGEAD